MNKVRLVLIEDNRLLREAMTTMIRKQRGLKLLATSGDFKNVMLEAQRLKPHVVLLDLDLRRHESLDVVEFFKNKIPEAKVVLMGLTPVGAALLEFVKAGVSGFILKQATFHDIVKTIRSVAEGAKVFPPALTGSLLSQITGDGMPSGNARLNTLAMTKREREVTDLIGKGLTNKEIAQRLHLATPTVKSHVHKVLEKLALHTRLQVAIYSRTGETPKTKADNIPRQSSSSHLKN